MHSYPGDWLVVAGDVGETVDHLDWTLGELEQRFAKLFWVPGNHDLWSIPGDTSGRGVDRYKKLVDVCRRRGCITPEDDFVPWPGGRGTSLIVPIFTLYDYSFRPEDIDFEEAVEWAAKVGVVASDEFLLHTDPFATFADWCRSRVQETESRLEEALRDHEGTTILVSHFPLRYCDAVLPRIPRFSIWCGTRLTERWISRFRAKICVTGHLHIRSTKIEGGCRYEEVSLGYPVDWEQRLGLDTYLRLIDTAGPC
jgi:3',5'-cyclic AMP phosphodiesterase CpdA